MGGTFVLLLAAGSGSRLGRPAKAFVDLAGIPMLLHCYRTILACRGIDGVVAVVPEGYVEEAAGWFGSLDSERKALIRIGGDVRQTSVRRGLEALAGEVDVVVCHDAARPFATASLFGRVIEPLRGGGGDGRREVDGVVPVVPSPDTVKRIREGLVVETIPRDQLGLVQTPQAFRLAALLDAHERADRTGLRATDDAMLLEAAGYRVAAVGGEVTNFKITTPEDLRRAEQLLARERMG